MISSLLHRLSLVECTLNSNAKLLAELQLLEFEAEPCQRDAQGARDIDTLGNFLQRLQPRLEQSTNRVNHLSGAVVNQRVHLADLKSDVVALPPGTRSAGTRLPSATDEDTSVDAASLPGELSSSTARATPLRPALRRACSPTDSLLPPGECVAVDPHCSHLGNMTATVEECVRLGSPAVLGVVDCAPPPREGVPSGGPLGADVTDIVLEMLEAEVQKQERLIHRMMLCNETLVSKEQEYERRNEWYEHKMRLLKQDKRRRGETIGKLLRCIDDMRETGGGGGGARTIDDTNDCYSVTLDRADQGAIGRGRMEVRGGGWAEDALRDAFQELQDEHRVRLRENASVEIFNPNDMHGFELDDDRGRAGLGSSEEDRARFGLGSDEDRGPTGLDRHQKRPDFVRHFPPMSNRSIAGSFLPLPLGLDPDNGNRRNLTSVPLPFAQ